MNKLTLALTIVAIGSYFFDPIASAEAAKRHSAKHHHKSHHRHSSTGERTPTVSWYGAEFHGKRTASGERFDMYAMTAASPNLPLSSYAEVTNLRNNRTVIVRINDRGPYHCKRAMDLSYSAAKELGIRGTAPVKITPLGRDVNLSQANSDTPG